MTLVLPSGLTVPDPEARLAAFCRKEYAYYDGIPDTAPDRILPVDVLATIAMNSWIGSKSGLNPADHVRLVHQGMAGACDALLPSIPVEADLLTFDPELGVFQGLIHAAVQARYVQVAVATKVLHRKRPGFLPMLDSVVMRHYLTALGHAGGHDGRLNSKDASAEVAVAVARAFREDLRASAGELDHIGGSLHALGFPLTPVRILEVLVWTQTEKNGYYRASNAAPSPDRDRTLDPTSSLGKIVVELIFVRNPTSGSGLVPVEGFDQHMEDRTRHGVKTIWWYDNHPVTGDRRPAYTPISGRSLRLIEGRGIRHGDRYVATFDVKEVKRQGTMQRQMWLVDAQPIGPAVLAHE